MATHSIFNIFLICYKLSLNINIIAYFNIAFSSFSILFTFSKVSVYDFHIQKRKIHYKFYKIKC